jgi:hypothetical protein
MTRYFNLKSVYGIETVDELSRKDFDKLRDFTAELRRLRIEYHLSGMPVYISTRSTKEWRNRA